MSGFIGNIIPKDPDAALTYGMAWGDWLGTRTIDTAVWTVPTGITKGVESINSAALVDDDGVSHAAGTVALVGLSGCTAGQNYTATCRVTTTDGDVDDRSIVIACGER